MLAESGSIKKLASTQMKVAIDDLVSARWTAVHAGDNRTVDICDTCIKAVRIALTQIVNAK